MIARLGFAFLGGCIGGGLRLLVGLVWDTGDGVPWQLLLINLVGSFVMGGVAVLWGGHRNLWPLLGPGMLGGFTTFSGVAAMAFVTTTSAMVSVLVLAASMVACTAAAWAGIRLAEHYRLRGAA